MQSVLFKGASVLDTPSSKYCNRNNNHFLCMLFLVAVPSCVNPIDQDSSNLSLEGQSAAEFSSNPDQTHQPVIFLMILKTMISMLRCV